MLSKALFLTAVLFVGQGYCQCYIATNCTGDDTTPAANKRDCCVWTEDGLSFLEGGACTNCIVHGFIRPEYVIVEDGQLDTEFRANVKGMTKTGGTVFNSGSLGAEPDGTASSSDFSSSDVQVNSDVTLFRLFAENDDITLEQYDRVSLIFTPSSIFDPNIITNLEAIGEFVRDTARVFISDNDRLEINFAQADYDITEGLTPSQPIILRFRTNQEPFTIKITPVNISTAEDMNLDSFIKTSAARAKSGLDFTDTPLVINVGANKNEVVVPYFFTIIDDEIDEFEQSFALVAEIGQEVPDNISCFQVPGTVECFGRFGATEIIINDNDEMVIGFEERYVTVSESDGPEGFDQFIIPINITSNITSEQEYRVQFRIQQGISVDPGVAKVGADPPNATDLDALFGTENNNVLRDSRVLLPSQTMILIFATIINDFVPEGEECFTIRIGTTDTPGLRTVFNCSLDDKLSDNFFCQLTICIEDDDEPFVVAFVETTYTVNEMENSVEVCVNLTEPMIDIRDETVNVFVVDEQTFVNGTPCSSVRASPDVPLFRTYQMLERTDYAQQLRRVNLIVDIQINATRRIVCYNQPIYDDLRLEKTEYFGLTLGVQRSTAITEAHETYDLATICILDDDVAVVGLEETFYRVSEEVGFVEVCAIVYSPSVECPIEFPFSVSLSTSDGTATSLMDYGALSTLLMFAACDTQSCVNVFITNDDTLENTESFFVNLDRNGLDSRITLAPTRGEIEILDDDDMAVVGLEETFYRVPEGVGFVEVCAIVYSPNGNLACPIDFAFEVDFSTSDGSAVFTMDYGSVDTTLPFAACDTQSCVNVPITNDDTLENTESFFVNLNRNGLDSRITLNPTRGEIEILDDDMAEVGLEKTLYRTAEGEGAVEVCAIVYMPDDTVPCPIAFEFTVLLSNAEFTAVTPMDYGELLDAPLVFPSCERKSCVDIPIVNDDVLENSELFNVALERNGLDGRITLDPVDGLVEITDNDDAVIRLERTMYTVDEDVVVVRVCTIVYRPTGSCPIAFDFTVEFFTTDISANAGSDYVDSDTLHMFVACEIKRCVNVGIINDDMTEDTEVLNISLGIPSDIRIAVSPPEGKIYILDNDMPNDTILVNDTVTGDPLMTVPVFDAPDIMNLCYEVHGEADRFFNLISDNCVAVNAHYARAGTNNPNIRLNVIDSVGVRAVSSNESCVNIQVDLEGCSATVDDVSVNMPYRANSISVRRYNNRVRIAVPNCRETDLVMWVFCTSGSTEDPFTWVYYNFDFLRFVVTRGINLDESSHGLIGQFWNVPVDVQEHTDLFNGENRDDDFTVTVRYPGSDDRRFVALRSSVTWEFEKKPCLYVGNSQAGPLGEVVDPNDSVIEGTYKDYIVESIFSPIFKFAHIDDENCMTK